MPASSRSVVGRLGMQPPAASARRRGDAEQDRIEATFERTIHEPSAGLRDLAGNACLSLEDLDRFYPAKSHATSDFRLLRVILREAITMGGLVYPGALPEQNAAPNAVEHREGADAKDMPATIESSAAEEFEAYTLEEPVQSPRQWSEAFGEHALAMHVGDHMLRMSKAEAVFFIEEIAEKDGDAPAVLLSAVDIARTSFEGWVNLLGVMTSRFLVAASTAALAGRATSANSAEA
ncbi:hypothetical protein MKK64_02095 [Methylobacterium sp. E-025]|uniref:hypothetical protein n=1 Tax=Methylobacterium sp. E-025 TaxID=2836561 RepID=UPI001FBAA73C|nr:hypothetical protein [Methylobacterium sp. E-025]MCJ2110010.1 hypothetical protein [Methylobacterium sp. E-025]